MRLLALAASTFILWLVAAACQDQDLSAPINGRDPGKPLFASLDCRYTPAGAVYIPVGGKQTFVPSAGNCDGAYGVLSPTDGKFGFKATTNPCTIFQTVESGSAHAFWVRKCLSGSGTFKIYTNSTKSTLLQTILLDAVP
jgi:hypothetical protein